MPDIQSIQLPRYQLPNQGLPPGVDAAPATPPNPLGTLGQNIQSGFGMGIQYQQAQRQQQELEMLKKQQENEALKGALTTLHSQFDTWSKINPAYATQMYKEKIEPLQNEYLKNHGIQINSSEIPEDHDTIDTYKQITKGMDEVIADPKKMQGFLGLLNHLESQMNVPKMVQDKIDSARKTTMDLNTMRHQQIMEENSTQGVSGRNDMRDKNRFRNYLLDIEQRDPIIKTMNMQGVSLSQMGQMTDLAKEGNTVAASAMGTKMARAMGEVGVLTETDVTRYVQSGQLDRKVADKLKKMMTGAPTAATLDEIDKIGVVLRNNFSERIQPRIDQYINSYSKIEDMSPQEFADKLNLPYGGGKSKGGGIVDVKSEAEANNLPKGTRFRLNGRTGTVQ